MTIMTIRQDFKVKLNLKTSFNFLFYCLDKHDNYFGDHGEKPRRKLPIH